MGDFDPQEAREIVERYYGPMAGTPPPPRRPVTARAIGKEIVIHHDERYGRNLRLHVAWHVPGKYTPEHAAGEVTARLLGASYASRLVTGVPEAAMVYASQESMLAGSVFHIEAEPRAGISSEALLKRIDAALELLRTQPPSPQQVEAAVRRILRERFLTMEDSLTKARFLIDVTSGAPDAGDPIVYEQRRFSGVQPEDVRRFAAKYLLPERRVVMIHAPAGGR